MMTPSYAEGFLTLLISGGLVVYNIPGWLRWCAVRLLTRAQVIEAAKVAHDDGIKEWKGRLKIEDRAAPVREEALNA